MASRLARIAELQTIEENTLDELTTLSGDATVAGGKPDATGPNAVQHDAYERKLWDRLRFVREQLVALNSIGDTISDGYV
jgi:hypothetical protein